MPSSSRIFAASFITSRSLELPIRMPTSGWAAFVRAAFAAGFAAGFGAFAAAFAEGFAAFAVMRFSLLFGARAGRVRCLALALFALDCAPRDVAAAVRSVPVNAIDGGVCRGRCIRNALAGRAHAEHTASGRDPMTRRIALGAGVKDLCTGRSRGIVDAVDAVAFADVTGIARCRHHDADRRSVLPLQAMARERAVDRRIDEVEQARIEAHHQRLALGVAEADRSEE